MKYNNIAPEGTFLGEYLRATSVLETAQSYDFWTAMWTLGSVLGRGVYVPRPHAPVYLNWYIMLVAESGVTRKSTAVRIGRDVVSQILGVDNMVEGRCTPEYLYTRLHTHPHLAVAVSELVTFLGRESYVIELPALLTDMYDCPPERRGGNMTRGERVVRDPYMTFISASTPSWLMGAVNPSVIEGGFTSRCMFILDEKPKKKVSWPEDVQGMDFAIKLLTHVTERAQEVGTIDLMPAARKRFDTWYRNRDTDTDIPFLSSFLAREDGHVLRAAACLAINDGTLAIDRKHMDAAIKLIAHAKACGLAIFAGGGNAVRLAQGIDKVSRLIIEAGAVGVGHTPLYAAVRHFLSAADFKIVIDYMHEASMIQIGIEQRKGGGPRPRRYFATRVMTDKKQMIALKQALL